MSKKQLSIRINEDLHNKMKELCGPEKEYNSVSHFVVHKIAEYVKKKELGEKWWNSLTDEQKSKVLEDE